jgi:hypothetical protein
MQSLAKNYVHHLANSYESGIDMRKVVDNLIMLYIENRISEKSFNYLIKFLISSTIERQLDETYLPKIFEFDRKFNKAINKLQV